MSESDPTTPAETPAPTAAAAPAVTPPAAAAPPAPPTPPAPPVVPSTQLAPPLPVATPSAAFAPPAPHPTSAFGTAASAMPAAPPKSARARSRALPVVAALAAGAVLGGASGAGVVAWALTANAPAQQQGSTSTPQTITVNDPDSVNVVNAVAAKAGPSVVTIAASSSSAAGTGSGVILSSDGYVLTNNHVVTLDGAASDAALEVTTADGRIFQAEIVGTDPIVDLAVIKLTDANGLTPIEFGDVDALDVGDRVVAIGAPLGLSNTVTDGIVSALNRSIQIASSAVPDDGTDSGGDPFSFDLPGQQQSSGGSGAISIPVIQTDAAINPGNSGGALVNDAGELVGINVAIANAGGASSTAGNIGVGFAIPADIAQRVAQELIDNGSATHGLLGATVRDASSADGSIVGAYIRDVTGGGAASTAGLRPGDIVTRFGGYPVTGSVDLTAQVRRHSAGETVEMTFVRGGSTETVNVTLGSLAG